MRVALAIIALAILVALCSITYMSWAINQKIKQDKANSDCPVWITPGTGDMRCP